jgi:hypothetical protein
MASPVDPMLRHKVEGNTAGFAVGQCSEMSIFVRPSRGSLNLESLLRSVNWTHSELIDEVCLDLRDRRARPKRVSRGGTVVLYGHLNLPAMVVVNPVTMLEREGLAMNFEDFNISILLEEGDGLINDATATPKLFDEYEHSSSFWKLHEIGFVTLALDKNINFCCHSISPWAQ